jgi:hypothetical protein
MVFITLGLISKNKWGYIQSDVFQCHLH